MLDPDVLAVAVFDESNKLVLFKGPMEQLEKTEISGQSNIYRRQGEDQKIIGILSISLTDTRILAHRNTRIFMAIALSGLLLVAVIFSAMIAN
jgi:hypothetical protein